jgi:hypothetical protein
MSKSRVGIIFMLVCLATSITFAQSFFSSTPSASPASPASSAPQPLSAEDFKNLTQQQNQITQSQLNQQVNKALAQQPFSSSVNPLNPANPVVPPAPTDNSTTTTDNSTAPPIDTQALTVPTAPSEPNTATPAAAPQPTNRPYTGYSSPTDNSSNGSGSSSQPGWGIKY